MARAAALRDPELDVDDGYGSDGPPRPPAPLDMMKRGYGRWPLTAKAALFLQ